VSIFDPTAGNVGVVAQLAAMTKLGKARTKFELFGDERTTDPRLLGGQAGRQVPRLVMPIDIEGDANLKNAFPCACQIYTPPQTITADGGQRGKKRFVAPAEMTHTPASRRRLLTIHFIAPAEITHTPWQAGDGCSRFVSLRLLKIHTHPGKPHCHFFFRQARAGSDRDAGA